MITVSFVQKVLVGLALFCLLLAVVMGVVRGRHNAQADFVLRQVATTQQGLQYFYNDHSRFPTTVEFADTSTMARYFSTAGTTEPAIRGCSDPLLEYASDSQKSYQISFCLPVARGAYPAGVSVINERKP
jgi:hypothetical protein